MTNPKLPHNAIPADKDDAGKRVVVNSVGQKLENKKARPFLIGPLYLCLIH